MMGLPRLRLPSRNWTIFLTLSTSLAGAIIYDKRETKRAQKKWCKVVQHLALEPVTDNKIMPRKLRVFLEAPPGDGLRVAQDHFREYVKPILVASGVDWELVQGRREGDIRAEVATRIRRERKGELPTDELDPVQRTRRNVGVKEFDGVKGDIVIGRNTWKEYVRGVHEGWLGPLESPRTPTEVARAELPGDSEAEPGTLPEVDGSPDKPETPGSENPAEAKDKPATKPPPTPAYISPSEYTSAPLPDPIPPVFDPAAPIPFPHILGFLNTPTRFRRFLTRRRLADAIGRDVAATVLSTSRPYSTATAATSFPSSSSSSAPSPPSPNPPNPSPSEIPHALIHEEADWDKSLFKAPSPAQEQENQNTARDAPAEEIWTAPIMTDARIASRMRKPALAPAAEAAARAVVVREEEIEGVVKGSLRWVWRWGTGALPREVGPGDVERRNGGLREDEG